MITPAVVSVAGLGAVSTKMLAFAAGTPELQLPPVIQSSDTVPSQVSATATPGKASALASASTNRRGVKRAC